MMTKDLEQVGTIPVERERLKMFVTTPARWSATCFEHPAWYPIRPGRFADVDAFEYDTHILLCDDQSAGCVLFGGGSL
jgi:hypothetical protein